jgi:hypothetical protein
MGSSAVLWIYEKLVYHTFFRRIVMKKKLFLMGICGVTLVFGLILAVGCNNIGDQTDDSPAQEDKEARVIFNLPNKNSRSLGTAQADTNFYEVILYKRAENGEGYAAHYNGSAAADAGSITLYVTEGTYDILMLAGNYTPSEESSYQFDILPSDRHPDGGDGGWDMGGALPAHILLASGYVKGKSIVMGTNTVNMTLNSIDCVVNIPSDLRIGQRYEDSIVSLTITLRNELLEENITIDSIGCGMATVQTQTALIDGGGLAGEWGKDEEGRWVRNPGAAEADRDAILVKDGKTEFADIADWRSTPTTPGEEDVIGVSYFWDDQLYSNYTWYLFNSFNTAYTGVMPTKITFADIPKVEFNVVWGTE